MSLQGRHFIILQRLTPLIAAIASLPGTPAIAAPKTQQERFAAAFAEAQSDERVVCDAVLPLPTEPTARGVTDDGPRSAASRAGDAALPAAEAEPKAEPDGVLPPRFLASVGVPVLRTQYDTRWRIVQQARLSFECARLVLDRTSPLDSPEQLGVFNRLINQIVRYTEDNGQDEWASAADTLRTGRGDCEDIAILKLQLLMAVGMPEDDVYFTLVHDLPRRRDHAVAVVRVGGRRWVLDSIADGLVDADWAAESYRPVVAFSGARKWLLGTERQAVNLSPVSVR